MKNQMQQYTTRTRGSIMLAVVVLLVLLALLGTAYIQQARYDRIASVAGVNSNIKIVAQSAVAYISDVLTSDLLNANRTMMFDGMTDEPYDYPWTNNTDTTNIKYPVEYYDEGSNTYITAYATGGTLDDTWLASTEPASWSSTPVWPHITNLNGYFLRLPKSGSGKSVPVERVTDYTDTTSPTWQLDYNVPFNNATDQTYLDNDNGGNYDTLGADADGDGIYDSKWTWAPIRQISGISYVMAVRIIDNSAMINANVALGQTSSSNTFDVTATGINAPRWLFPSELDIANFFYLSPSTATTTNVEDYFTTRFAGSTVSSSLIPWFGTTHTRYDFWQSAGRLWKNYGSGYTALTNTDEMDLRYRNGLNNSNATTPLETSGIGTFLRMASSSETAWGDWDGATASTMQTFFEDEPRHQMTTSSGQAIYAMRLMDATVPITFNSTIYTPAQFNDTAFLLKKNINKLTKDELAFEVFKAIVRGTGSNAFKGYSTLTEYETYANQFTASFADHVDADNWMTSYQNANGVEAWPAITEAYTQRPVQVSTFSNLNVKTVNATGNPIGTTGYVIELINPHTKPIPISDIFIDLTYTDTSATPTKKTVYFKPDGTTSATKLEDIIDRSTGTNPNAVKHANHGDTWLYPGEKVIIYHDSTGGSTNSQTSDRLRDRDDVTTYIFDDSYPTWTSGASYTTGELVYKVYNGTYAVYECLVAHTASATNSPNDAGYSVVSGHTYWRRKIIAVDGGPWQVPDSDFDPTHMVGINLYPATQASSGINAASIPYQTVSVEATNSSNSVSASNVAYDVSLFNITASYVAGDLARDTIDLKVYQCTDAATATSSDPSTNSGAWAISDTNNVFYAQKNSVGSVDGLEAFAFPDSGFVRNDSETQTPVAPHSKFFTQIGKESKGVSPSIWTATTHYTRDVSKVFNGGKSYACIVTHDSTLSFAADIENWVQISDAGAADPSSGIRGNSDQLMLTDMRTTHSYWQDGQNYSAGEIVRGQNDSRTFICILGHTTASTNEPITGASSGTYWVEHWRSATDGYKVASVAELAQVLVAGPTSSKTLPDILGDSTLIPTGTHIDSLMLPLDTTAVADVDSMAVPQALALMQRLDIADPHSDNLDNDNDSTIDNADELLIPGTININTIPEHLLQKILPIPDATLRNNVAKALIDYRDLVSSRPSSWRSAPGFASSAEIYRALQSGTSTSLQSGAYAGDTATIPTNDTLVDFENVDPYTNDQIDDDREEAMLLPKMLMNVTSARSDIFTAYIYIRGYSSSDFTKGPIESKRMIAVFDRSNIVDGASTPKIIGMYEY